jgi:hypothetical protein
MTQLNFQKDREKYEILVPLEDVITVAMKNVVGVLDYNNKQQTNSVA